MIGHAFLNIFLMILLSGIAWGGPVNFEFIPMNADVDDTYTHWDDGDMSSSSSALIGKAPGSSPAFMLKSGNSFIFLDPAQPSNKFTIRAQASADGDGGGFLGVGWTDDGSADFTFKWTVPYTYSRQVTIDQSGPVATATFPVVERVFKVEAVRMLWADTDQNYTKTYAVADPLKAGGTDLAPVTVLGGASVGPHASGASRYYVDWRTVYLQRTDWAAPSIGDSFSLTLDPSTQLFTQPRDEQSVPSFFIQTALHADSWGSTQSDGPFGTFFGGGEALACYGGNSTLSSFSADCWDQSGIFVTGLFSVDSYITLPIEYLGGDQNQQNWRVLSAASVPEPTTVLLLGFGLIGLAGLRRR
jgi:hypothetical protein